MDGLSSCRTALGPAVYAPWLHTSGMSSMYQGMACSSHRSVSSCPSKTTQTG